MRNNGMAMSLDTAVDYAAMLASSLTVEQAAALLKVDCSRIRHRLADRTLYGIREASYPVSVRIR